MGNLFNKDRIRHFLHFNRWIVLVDIAAFSLSYLLTLYIRFIVERVLNLKIYAQKARFGSKTDHILQGNALFNYQIAA